MLILTISKINQMLSQYGKKPTEEIAKEYKLSTDQIHHLAHRYREGEATGGYARKRWTPQEDARLLRMLEKYQRPYIALKLNRSLKAVNHRISLLRKEGSDGK